MFIALSSWFTGMNQPEPSSAPRPFDDGLVQLARLIETAEPRVRNDGVEPQGTVLSAIAETFDR